MLDKLATLTAAALVNLSGPQDEMFIVHFSDHVYTDQDWTNDQTKPGEAFNLVNARGGGSLRDAFSLAIDKARSGVKERNQGAASDHGRGR